ncbi:pre-mRNA-processing protein 40C isoform X1 [Senna tora]|uniref:Pre-mRNA-processing protein 40C isoform X1 n=1 Tax=Senna tora TaxID=362788 RepID=A0A834TU09_9FABA|nr:pre-mRNA-processing protein 40C isoform X1 [Senna tora]
MSSFGAAVGMLSSRFTSVIAPSLVMASPAWLTQEAQPPVSQIPVSGQPTGETSVGSSTSNSASTPPGAVLSVSYNNVHQSANASGNSQPTSILSVMKSHSTVSPMVVQPRVPGLSPSAVPSFSYNISPSVVFPTDQHSQSSTNKSDSVAKDADKVSSASSIPHSAPPYTSISTMPVSSDSNYRPATSWMPTAPSFPVHRVMPGTPGPPGLSSASSISPNPVAPSSMADSSSSTVPRQNMPIAPMSSNPVGPNMGFPYPSVPGMAVKGLWLQPPQMSGISRPPFLPYSSAVPVPFPFPAHGVTLPAVPVPDSQPPGVTPVGATGSTSVSASAISHHQRGTTGLPMEVISGHTDDRKKMNATATQNQDALNDQLDAWTAHKTEADIVYYYNALTGESTYDKPAGFKAEPDKVSVQPTPASMVNLPGTDWVLVTTSDGKKYYYNNRTKTSCWQIPSEVTELKKKQDGDATKENLMSVSNANVLSERGSGMVTLNAPAINTGGRDAAAFRSSSSQGSSSALDLIKKKLQDSGTPVTPSSIPVPSVQTGSESNGSKAPESIAKSLQSENSKDKQKDSNGDAIISDTSSDSEDEEKGPSKEERIIQFKEMLKERGVAPFSKWEKELPKIVFDPRFKCTITSDFIMDSYPYGWHQQDFYCGLSVQLQAIPSYSARRSLFEHYVKTRAEEERKEKRAAQKAAIEKFKQLLDEVSEDINHNTDYQTFRKKWGNDPRFEALDRKDQEQLLNESSPGHVMYDLLTMVAKLVSHTIQVLPLKKAAEEKAQAMRAAAAASFKSMLHERGDINVNSRWSRVKESLRNDPRYKSVRHEDRDVLFNEYISELKAAEQAAERETKAKREEQILTVETDLQDKLKERERELRKRKEREEQEMERVRLKVRRKEAVTSFQALLVETIKDPMASWTESKPKLEKDPQGRATNPDLDPSDTEKLFREHIKMLQERCAQEFRALLTEVLTFEAASQESNEGKTVYNSWSTAKRLLKSDPRYNKVPRKEREVMWRRYAEDMVRRKKSAHDPREEKHDAKGRNSLERR